MAFKKKDETKPEAVIEEVAKSMEPGEPKDEEKKSLEAKLAEAQAKIAELEAKSATLVDEPDPDYHILMHTKYKGDHVRLVNGKTVEFKNGYAKIPRSDTTSYELLKKTKLWGSEYIEVNKMAIVQSGPGVQTGPLSTLRGKPIGGN